MFSMENRYIHSMRKRILGTMYAKSVLQTSAALAEICESVLCRRMLPRISAAPEGALEAYELFSAVALDFVTTYIFDIQQSPNFGDSPEAGRKWLHDYKSRGPYLFCLQEMPNVFRLFLKIGLGRLLVPDWVGSKSVKIEDDCLEWCDAAEDAIVSGRALVSPGSYPTVYGQLRNEFIQVDEQDTQLSQEERLDVASDMLDHLAAGFDTTGITLTCLAWEVSRPHNAPIQRKLQEELRSLNPTISMAHDARAGPSLAGAKDIDDLPMLHAVVMETLRLHAAIPGGQPRTTPANATLGPPGAEVQDIPAGVRVVSAAFLLPRNPNAFPDPETWYPERWLDSNGHVDSGGDERRWFWSFGSGGRMCIDNNLAMTEMKGVVAALWSSFTTTVVNDAGMEHVDGYLAQPRGT